jgi:N-dimethylarginine dimethylaminohydrolase
MSHPDLSDIKSSIDRVEQKLDKYIEVSQTNKVDIEWVKGFIKTSTSIFTTILGAIVSYLFSQHSKG